MPTRRALLSRAVALTVGGSLAVEPTAGQSPDQYTDSAAPTDVTVTGDPAILGLTGLPGSIDSPLPAVRRHFRSVPISDVNRLAGTVCTRGTRLHNGAGTAWGSFDVQSVATELQARTAFSPVGRGDDADAPGSRRPGNTGENLSRKSAKREVLARSEPFAVVLIEPTRIDAVCGDSRRDAGRRLTGRRRQIEAPDDQGRSATALASILGGDVVADASVGEVTRERIRPLLPDPGGALGSIVRATRQAGLAAVVDSEKTRVRYAISLADTHRVDDELTELKADLRAHEATHFLEEYASETTVVADVVAPTDSVWAVHETLLGS